MSGGDESWASGAFTSCPTLDAFEELCSLRRTLENTHLVSQEAELRARIAELEERRALVIRLADGGLDPVEEEGIRWRIAEIDEGRALDRDR